MTKMPEKYSDVCVERIVRGNMSKAEKCSAFFLSVVSEQPLK